MADATASIDDVIAGITLPERTLPLCLSGDLQAEWEDLERQLQAAQQTAQVSLAGPSPDVKELLQRMDDVAAQMRDHQVIFRFRALTSRGYSDLVAAHRLPEEEIRDDDPEGINRETFPVALVAACCISPAMTVGQAERLCDAVTDAQWGELFERARIVNRTLVTVPPSLSSSAVRAGTAPNSRAPALGGSAADGGSAGSLACRSLLRSRQCRYRRAVPKNDLPRRAR